MGNDDCFENKLWEKTNEIHNQYEENKDFYKAGWNAAIEKAANTVPEYEDDKMTDIKEAIRKLKR